MTTASPTVYGQFGQTLAFAERALTATLREHLAQRDVTPPTWYALKLIAQRPGLSHQELVSGLAGSRELNADLAREVVARLTAEGLISGDAHVKLTADGQARYDDLREYVGTATIRLLSQFDLRDVETTVRTLQAVTKRAAEEEEATATV
jgi:DNA-binding MarR family transcriptional regulator